MSADTPELKSVLTGPCYDSAAMNQTPQRDYWTGQQTELGDVWTFHKDDKVARCVLYSHLFGHELKLFIDGELFRSQVCRSSDEVLNTQEAWKAAMLEKGWR